MDFIEVLPKSEGYDSVLLMDDRSSKYAHFITLRHPFTAHTVVGVFTKEVIRLHGTPRLIIYDSDKAFFEFFLD